MSSLFLTLLNNSNSEKNKKSIKIAVDNQSVTLYFDHDFDLIKQKQKISSKVDDLDQKIKGINNKLKNKSFLNNAPKRIVAKEKKALLANKIEDMLNTVFRQIAFYEFEKKIHELRKDFTNIRGEGDYEGLLETLASVKNELNEFFDNVIVYS